MKKVFLILSVLVFCAAPVFGQGEELDVEVEEVGEINPDARAVIALKVEALKWKKKFYQQQAIAMHQNYIIKCWNDTAFQDIQRFGRETDKELKRLLILQ